MTKEAAICTFFSSFDLPAYEASDVLPDIPYPYLDYTAPTGFWGDGENAVTVNLWYNTSSNVVPNAKAQEIADAIGPGGYTLACDGGMVWIKRGSPWCQSLVDAVNKSIKRRYINVTVEYLTRN